jgi:hypothetical protein
MIEGVAGTSGWSRLLAQCSITPDEFLAAGGPGAKVFPTSATDPSMPPPGSAMAQDVQLMDGLIEDDRITYGFTGMKFAALL